MITWKDFETIRWDSYVQIQIMVDNLLKERDEALEAKKAAELRAESYREVARNIGHVCHRKNCKCGIDIDAAAARIMEEKGGAV